MVLLQLKQEEGGIRGKNDCCATCAVDGHMAKHIFWVPFGRGEGMEVSKACWGQI